MLTWYELEERAEAVVDEVERVDLERMAFLEDMEAEQPPLRRRIASAMIRLGVKLDPEAAESVGRPELAGEVA